MPRSRAGEPALSGYAYARTNPQEGSFGLSWPHRGPPDEDNGPAVLGSGLRPLLPVYGHSRWTHCNHANDDACDEPRERRRAGLLPLPHHSGYRDFARANCQPKASGRVRTVWT